MLTLKIKNKVVEPAFSYRFYKNIAGKDKEKRSDNFNEFLNGIFSDDSDAVIDFFRGSFGSDLSDDDIAEQLEENGSFDDIHALTNEIIRGLSNSGFLATKIAALKKYDENLIAGYNKALKFKSTVQSDKDMIQVQIDTLKEHIKMIENRVKESKSMPSAKK